jgi:hypothetical protein
VGGAAEDFLRELREMLAHVRPAALDGEPRVNEEPPGFRVELVHAENPDWSIWALFGDDGGEVVVGVAQMHEHLEHASEAIDMIAELLRGEIEIHTTYRGNFPATIRHYLVDDDGTRRELGLTGTVGSLAMWRPTRTTVERVSFDAQG